MTCRSCGRESFVLKTHKHARLDVRKRACECGDTWETNEREVGGTRATGEPRKRPATATVEPPPGHAQATNGQPIASRHSSVSDQKSLPSADSDQTPARVEPVAFSFDVVANDGKQWGLPQSRHVEFVAAFPSVDVASEYRKIAAWLSANQTNRKTPAGMPRFLFRWLSKAQDRGGSSPRLPLSSVPPWRQAERDEEARKRKAASEEQRALREMREEQEKAMRGVG